MILFFCGIFAKTRVCTFFLQEFSEAELDELAREARLLKKFKAGKVCKWLVNGCCVFVIELSQSCC